MHNYTAADAYFDSRSSACKAPFGAVKTGEAVTFTLYLSQRLEDAQVFFCTHFEGRETPWLMERKPDEPLSRCITLHFDDIGNRAYWFCVNDGSRLLYYGAKNPFGGVGVLTPDYVTPYQLTVYDANYQTPDWFKGAVAYHIFVDRFCRGGGRGGLDRADYHRSMGRTVVLHQDWNEPVMYTPLPGADYYDPCDFYGGDLLGIESRLDYLKSLGVSVLYLSPVFESPSNHKYNTSDYLRIDPMFGTEADFARLCEKAKALGIRVMLDGVFSHTGDDSLYFDKYHRYGNGACDSPHSPYYSWYDFSIYPTRYRSWWGFPSLPEVNETEPSYQQFIATGDDAVLKHWVRKGASGWRLDVADELPDSFIATLRTALKAEDPEAVLLGEVWEDASNKFSMNTRRQYVHGFELDSVMNYPLREALLGFFTQKLDADQCAQRLESLRENYPPAFYESCLNLISSHDVPRALTLLGGGPDKDSGLDRAAQAAFSLSPKARKRATALLKAAYATLMVLPGVPCIYYGDEAGLEGCMDPFNRAPYPYGKEDKDLQKSVALWANLRNHIPALQRGSAQARAPHRDVLHIDRSPWHFFANRSDAPRTVEFPQPGMEVMAATGERPVISAAGRLTLPPLCAVLLK